ncbi:MAG: hypothetical protein ACRC7N_04925 [Clostridium sp.]
MFNKEELKELKFSINTMISERISYRMYETSKKRLEANEKYLQLDYELLAKIIKLMEEDNE